MDLARQMGIVHHTAHPHVAADGAVFNLATVPKLNGPHYCVVNFPRSDPGTVVKTNIFRRELLFTEDIRTYNSAVLDRI